MFKWCDCGLSLSKCCRAGTEVGGETTKYLICRKYHKACDTYVCDKCLTQKNEEKCDSECGCHCPMPQHGDQYSNHPIECPCCKKEQPKENCQDCGAINSPGFLRCNACLCKNGYHLHANHLSCFATPPPDQSLGENWIRKLLEQCTGNNNETLLFSDRVIRFIQKLLKEAEQKAREKCQGAHFNDVEGLVEKAGKEERERKTAMCRYCR